MTTSPESLGRSQSAEICAVYRRPTEYTSGDVQEIAKVVADLSRDKLNGLASSLMLSIWCAEDIPRLTATNASSVRSLLGFRVLPDVIMASRVATRDYRCFVRQSRLVGRFNLLMSGGRHPATPAYLADSMAIGFLRAERYNDHEAGHSTRRV